jgi:hypothetical protein
MKHPDPSIALCPKVRTIDRQKQTWNEILLLCLSRIVANAVLIEQGDAPSESGYP